MDIVWERKNLFSDVLGDCEEGTVVLLMSRPRKGPFLITDLIDDLKNRCLLFNLVEHTSYCFDLDERVEVLQAELHIS